MREWGGGVIIIWSDVLAVILFDWFLEIEFFKNKCAMRESM